MNRNIIYPPRPKSSPCLVANRDLGRLVLVGILIFCASIFMQSSYAQQALVNMEQRIRNRIEIALVEELSSTAADFMLECRQDEMIIITRSLKRYIGFPEGQRRLKRDFTTYALRPVNRSRRFFKISEIESNFGSQVNTIGFAQHLATGMTIQTQMVPISRAQKTGEGIVLVPQLSAQDKPKSALGNQLEEVANINRSWSAFHPAMHPSGELIVFAANRQMESSRFDPDGTGKIDLYVTCKFGNIWTTPVKFDTLINSPEDELFPSFSEDGDLYFASNRAGGLGGFDLYVAQVNFRAIFDNAQFPWWSRAHPLPAPFNSQHDELALCWMQDSLLKRPKGYFSRKIAQQATDFDIFSFQIQGPLYIGRVISLDTESPLPGASIFLVDTHGDTASTETDEKGEFRLPLQFDQQYLLQVSAPHYLATPWRMISTFSLANCIEPEITTITLDQIQIPQRVIKGTVQSFDGRSLLTHTAIEFYSTDPHFVAPEIKRYPEYFLLHTNREVEFYIDARSERPTESTWHYDPGFQAGKDTVHANLVLHDTSYVIRRIVIVVRGAEEPTNVVNGLLGNRSNNRSPYLEIASDESRASNIIRLATPVEDCGNCKLILLASDAQPRVINPTHNMLELPDTVQLESSHLWYVEPLKIFHKYNEGEPDFSMSETDLDAISFFLSQDSLPQVCITSYTDCRGSQAYNISLSLRRAESVKTYILNHINHDFEARIFTCGLGIAPSKLTCAQCTPKMHQANRRTEILLTHGTCASTRQEPILIR